MTEATCCTCNCQRAASWPATAETRLLLSVPETVKALGISKAKLFRLMAAGDIEGVKIGGRRLFKSEEVDRYVRSLPPSPPLSQISGPRKPS